MDFTKRTRYLALHCQELPGNAAAEKASLLNLKRQPLRGWPPRAGRGMPGNITGCHHGADEHRESASNVDRHLTLGR